MNQQLQIMQPPNPPGMAIASDFKTLQLKSRELGEWAQRLSLWLKGTVLAPIVSQLNGQTQGISTLASAGTIAPSTTVTHITGVATISTITPPSGFSGLAWLIADGAFSLTTGGNIALARGPYTVGQVVTLIYDPATALWYPN